MKQLHVIICTLTLCIISLQFVSSQRSKTPIVVTDGNWTSILSGEWMVEFMAPWCPACKSFKSTWEEFASWGYDLDISVGVVDVTENPGLSGRFLVTSLPTLYHVKEGVFRYYSGGRKTADLISVIDEKKWQKMEPVSWYRDPSSIQMGIVGTFFKAAMFIRGVYNTMTDVYGVPEWACYVIFAVMTIIVGLILGLLLVLCCDNFFPAKYIPLPPERIAHKPGDYPADDTDIRDDTVDDKNSSNDSKKDKKPEAEDSKTSTENTDLRKRQTRKDD